MSPRSHYSILYPENHLFRRRAELLDKMTIFLSASGMRPLLLLVTALMGCVAADRHSLQPQQHEDDSSEQQQQHGNIHLAHPFTVEEHQFAMPPPPMRHDPITHLPLFQHPLLQDPLHHVLTNAFHQMQAQLHSAEQEHEVPNIPILNPADFLHSHQAESEGDKHVPIEPPPVHPLVAPPTIHETHQTHPGPLPLEHPSGTEHVHNHETQSPDHSTSTIHEEPAYAKVTLVKLLGVATPNKVQEFFVDSRTQKLTLLLRSNEGPLPEIRFQPPTTSNDKPTEKSRTPESVSYMVESPTPGLWTVTLSNSGHRKSRWSLSVEGQSQVDFRVSILTATHPTSPTDFEPCRSGVPVKVPKAGGEVIVRVATQGGLSKKCQPTDVELRSTDGAVIASAKIVETEETKTETANEDYCSGPQRVPARPFYVVINGSCLGKRRKNIEFTQRTMPELVQPADADAEVKPQPTQSAAASQMISTTHSLSGSTKQLAYTDTTIPTATVQKQDDNPIVVVVKEDNNATSAPLSTITTDDHKKPTSTATSATTTVPNKPVSEPKQPAPDQQYKSITPQSASISPSNDVCNIISTSVNRSCSQLHWYNSCSKYYWEARVVLQGVGHGSTVSFESAGGQVNWRLSETLVGTGTGSGVGQKQTAASARGSCCVVRVNVHVMHNGVKTTCVVRNTLQSTATSLVNSRLIIVTLSILLGVCALALAIMVAVHFWRQKAKNNPVPKAQQLSQLAFDNNLYGKKLADGENLKQSSET